MKIYYVMNRKTNKKIKFKETNKKGIALLFTTTLAKWELTKSKEWKKYCEKYGNDTQKFDTHLDQLEKAERKEFFSDFVGNVNTCNPLYEIIKVKELEQERELC